MEDLTGCRFPIAEARLAVICPRSDLTSYPIGDGTVRIIVSGGLNPECNGDANSGVLNSP